MFNQTYDAQRFSALKQIDATNVGQLKEVCRVRVGELGGFGPGPIIVGGVLYVTAGNATIAMNPVDSGILWKTIYTSEGRAPLGTRLCRRAFVPRRGRRLLRLQRRPGVDSPQG